MSRRLNGTKKKCERRSRTPEFRPRSLPFTTSQKGECPYGHTATNALPFSAGAFFYSQGNPLPLPGPWESLAKNMVWERQAPLKGKNNGVGEREEPGWTGPIAPAPSLSQHLQPDLSLPVSFSPTAPKESAKFTHFQRSKPPRCRLSRWTFTMGAAQRTPLGNTLAPPRPQLDLPVWLQLLPPGRRPSQPARPPPFFPAGAL